MPTEAESQQILSSYESPATIVRLFLALSVQDIASAQRLLDDLHRIVGTNGRTKSPAKQGTKQAANFAAAALALMKQDNQRMTKVLLMSLCGLSDNSIHSLLYTTNKSDFEGQRNFDGKASGFRLTEQGLQKARELMK